VLGVQFSLQSTVDYSMECNVPARKRLNVAEFIERDFEALLYDQNTTKSGETEEALGNIQDRFEEEIKSRYSKYYRQQFKRLEKSTNKESDRNDWNTKYSCIKVKTNANRKYNNRYNLQHQNLNLNDTRDYTKKENIRSKNNQTNNKKQYNDEYWRCGEHSHEQRDCSNNANELQVIEKQSLEQNSDRILLMLGIDKIMKDPDKIETKLHNNEIGTIHAIADTEASIRAINDSIANKFQYVLTNDVIAFVVAHDGGSIILQQKLELNINNANNKHQRV
ncbi:putative lipoprotein, partial [Reticulomyxa filosa]